MVTPGAIPPFPLLKADESARLLPADAPTKKTRFGLLLAACLAAHVLLVAVFFLSDFFGAADATRLEEIPVEIVTEMPAAPTEQKNEVAQDLPRPEPDLVTPPRVIEKPPPEKVELDDVQVAHDAPVAGNDNKVLKGQPEQETKAPRVAPPPKLVSPEPPQNKPEQEKAASPESEPTKPEQPPEPQKLADDTPDAEALEKAQPQPPVKPQQKQKPPSTKAPPAQGKNANVAKQLAALEQAPSYSFGSSAKAAPISGGSEKASYESLLMGLIIRHLHVPAEARANHLLHIGQIGLFVDELGHLTHQAVYRASGDPLLDAAYLEAVRRAAPFPAPPRGLAHSFILQYTNFE